MIAPVTPRELPASEVHPAPRLPTHGLCLVGGSDPLLPGFRKVTLGDQESDLEMEVGSKAVRRSVVF